MPKDLTKSSKPSEYLSPLRVALALGVSESSVKRWCDAGALPSVRTVGGHRRIRRTSLTEFAQGGGPPIYDPAALVREPLQGGADPHYDPKAFLRALCHDDREAVARMVADLRGRGASFDSIADRLLMPALVAMGERWQDGRLEIFEERRACELVHEALRNARVASPPESSAPLAIGGALTGDPYSLPSALAECVLAERGFDARSLGLGLPVETFAKAVRQKKPALVWLCLNDKLDAGTRERSYAVIQEACDKVRAVLAVGGRTLGARARNSLPRAICCGTMGDLAALAAAVFRARSAGRLDRHEASA